MDLLLTLYFSKIKKKNGSFNLFNHKEHKEFSRECANELGHSVSQCSYEVSQC